MTSLENLKEERLELAWKELIRALENLRTSEILTARQSEAVKAATSVASRFRAHAGQNKS